MNQSEQEFLQKFSDELREELLEDILPYWLENTVDHEKGGFFGQITFHNDPVKDAEKGSILTARVLWAFSASHKKFQHEKYREMADHAYDYLNGALWDDKNGGVYWMTDADGSPADSRKHVYAEAFTIYALAEYYSAFGRKKALKKAQDLYQLIEDHCYDKQHGGYFEAFTAEWKLMDDVRLSDKDRNEPKSMNTHLHVLEAYTNLYRYWKDPELKERLTSLLDIFADHIVNKDHTSLNTFLAEDWTPRSNEISYGHDIETSWLLLEAADVLEDYHRHGEIKEISLNLVEQVKQEGVDPKYGGLYNEAGPEGLTDDNKDWWPQAEAIVGFFNAYQLTGKLQYLHDSYEIWEFIKEYMLDKQFGEWHEKVTRSGDPFQLDKVRSWKCPYHNGRTALEIIHRVEKMIESEDAGISTSSISDSSAVEH